MIRTAMNKFVDLLKESVIFQGIITVGILTVACYLLITTGTIPAPLEQWATIIIGFFFGSKVVQATRKG